MAVRTRLLGGTIYLADRATGMAMKTNLTVRYTVIRTKTLEKQPYQLAACAEEGHHLNLKLKIFMPRLWITLKVVGTSQTGMTRQEMDI